MDKGYIKLWRKSLDNPFFKNPILWHFWEYCLLKATWKPMKALVGYQEIQLLPGQFIYGRQKASIESGLSERNCRTCIKNLEILGNLTIKVTNKFSIITIINWSAYQCDENESDQQSDQQVTNKRPASDQQVTTYKNVKKLKNKKKEENTYIPEPENPASGKDVIPSVFEIPLNTGKTHPVTQADIDRWQALFPSVDVPQECRGMIAWCEGHPEKRKTKRGVVRFITGWLSRKQDAGGRKSQASSARSTTADAFAELARRTNGNH